jgi:hypothetical protein
MNTWESIPDLDIFVGRENPFKTAHAKVTKDSPAYENLQNSLRNIELLKKQVTEITRNTNYDADTNCPEYEFLLLQKS